MGIKSAILFSAVLLLSSRVNYADRYITITDTLPVADQGDQVVSDTIITLKSGETVCLHTGTYRTESTDWGLVPEGRYAGQSEWYIERIGADDSLISPRYYIDGPVEVRVRYFANNDVPAEVDMEVVLFVSGTPDEAVTPASGVVIPTDAVGDVQIVLESSADQINWVSTPPGLFAPGTTNRFFRLRAIPTENN